MHHTKNVSSYISGECSYGSACTSAQSDLRPTFPQICQCNPILQISGQCSSQLTLTVFEASLSVYDVVLGSRRVHKSMLKSKTARVEIRGTNTACFISSFLHVASSVLKGKHL